MIDIRLLFLIQDDIKICWKEYSCKELSKSKKKIIGKLKYDLNVGDGEHLISVTEISMGNQIPNYSQFF